MNPSHGWLGPGPVHPWLTPSLLQAVELSRPLLDDIVELLTRAQSQFRKYSLRRVPLPRDPKGQPRFKEVSFTRMVDLLGQEIGATLNAAGRHEEALKFLLPALGKYRAEEWNQLLTAALNEIERWVTSACGV